MLFQPLVLIGVAELGDVLGDVGSQGPIIVSELKVLMAAQRVHHIHKIGPQALAFVLSRVLELQLQALVGFYPLALAFVHRPPAPATPVQL